MVELAPKSSYFASVGQASTRISQDQIFKRLRKKGNYKKKKYFPFFFSFGLRDMF